MVDTVESVAYLDVCPMISSSETFRTWGTCPATNVEQQLGQNQARHWHVNIHIDPWTSSIMQVLHICREKLKI